MAWCAQCHVEFTPTRDGQKYHSNSCRQKAYRRRHWARGESQPKTDPLREYRDRLRDLGVQIPEAEAIPDQDRQLPATPIFVEGETSDSVTRDANPDWLNQKAAELGLPAHRLKSLLASAEATGPEAEHARDFLRQIGLS